MNTRTNTTADHSGPARQMKSVNLRPHTLVSLVARVSLTLLLLAGVTHAVGGAYEPFDYTATIPDGTASTASGFTGVWTCGTTPSIGAGLTYPNLPTANGSFSSSSGRQSENLVSALSSGTRWISFLFGQAGNNGANTCGVYFPNGGTGLFFGYGLAPFSSTQGGLGLGSIATTGAGVLGATNLASSFLGTYGTPYLVVLRIEFNTSGPNDTITVYLDPTADAAAPGVAATYTVTTFDVGTITGVGFQNQGGGFAINVDEIRVGDTYGDVVGHVSAPPNAPTGLGATAGSNSVTLTWIAATGDPTGYNIKRSTNSGSGYLTVGTTNAPAVAFTDSVLGGRTYYYVVSAVNGGGESTNSPEVSASPALAAPEAPTGLAAIAGDAQVALSWTASSFATSYNVKRAIAPAGPYTTVGITTAPTVTYTDTNGLTNGLTYHYVVSATGAGGSSADSTAVSVVPEGPEPLVADVVRGTGIRWFASNGVIYQVQWTSELLGTNTLWNNLGDALTGNGSTNTVFDPVGSPHNYYRVLSTQ